MGCFLSVGKGSVHKSLFLELHYNGNGDAPPIALVGKGTHVYMNRVGVWN